MIAVTIQEEPERFNELVRKPGDAFLSKCPAPKGKQWKGHSYWTRVSNDLHRAYGGICAYSCHFIQYDTGWRTTEHFKPKDFYPKDAYDWSNYRLVCGVLNGRKGTRSIIDPFTIQDNWYVIDFPSLLVKPASNIKGKLREDLITTSEILGLNDEGTCMASRTKYVEDYCLGGITFEHLERDAPFLGRELRRQNLIDSIKNVMVFDRDDAT